MSARVTSAPCPYEHLCLSSTSGPIPRTNHDLSLRSMRATNERLISMICISALSLYSALEGRKAEPKISYVCDRIYFIY